MVFSSALLDYISNLHSPADTSSTSTMDAILEHKRILDYIGSQVQQNGIGKLDYTNVQLKLAVLQMKATTDYSDDCDHNGTNVSNDTLSTDDRIQLCEEAFGNITSCHDLRKMILPSTHKRVREANHIKEKAKDLLLYLNRFRSFEIWVARKHLLLQGHHAPTE